MKIIMFGINSCPNCVNAVKELDERHADYVYMDFSENIANLKRFLKIRESEQMFDEVRAGGRVGVPLFKLSDGTLTFSLEEVLSKLDQ